MSTKLLTNLLFKPKGKHDPALTYSIKDTVMSADGSRVYFALRDVPAGIALSDEEYWKLQIDLSASKTSMDNAVADFANYAKMVGTKVRGETANASGNPVSFLPDAGSLLQPVTELEPQQEGSGDPYPAGGGKNLCNLVFSSSDLSIAQNADGTITATNNTGGDVSGPRCELTGVLPAGTYTISRNDTPNDVFLQTSSSDYSNNITTYTFNYDGVSYLRILCSNINDGRSVTYKIQLERGSAATEYAPPSNIRPFIGYDKLDLNHLGKNLMIGVNGYTPSSPLSITANRDDYSVILRDTTCYLVKGKTYTFNMHTDGTHGRTPGTDTVEFYLLKNLTYDDLIDSDNAKRDGTLLYKTFVCQATGDYSIRIDVNQNGKTHSFWNFMITEGSVSTEHAPCQNTLHTVQLGQTVYGIRYEWLTGKAWIEWAMETLKSADASKWTYVTDYGSVSRFNYDNNNVMPSGDVICNTFPPVSIGTSDVEGIAVHGSQRQIILQVKTDRLASKDVDGLSIWLAGTPIQIVYKLATPIEIQLTPHIISAVEPEQNNTLYGDGSIEVEYVKPLHVSIEERVAAALAAAAE